MHAAPLPVDPISATFRVFSDSVHLTVLANNIDRHGSIEWSAVQRGPLNRYMSLSFTPLVNEQANGTEAPYQMEIWYSVDNTIRFQRKRSYSELIVFSTARSLAFLSMLNFQLLQAWREVLLVQESALIEPILFPVYGNNTVDKALRSALSVPPETVSSDSLKSMPRTKP